MPTRVLAFACLVSLALAACGRRETRTAAGDPAGSTAAAPLALPVRVIADSGRSQRLPVVPPPEARVWVSRVTPARAEPPAPPLPEPAADTPLPVVEPPTLAIDDDLKPPVLRTPALLHLPATLRRGGRPRSVELDVRVNEQGDVSDALWAGGSDDSTLVAAAIDCAMRMRFYAALRAGEPVAVWCRQRFDFAPR